MFESSSLQGTCRQPPGSTFLDEAEQKAGKLQAHCYSGHIVQRLTVRPCAFAWLVTFNLLTLVRGTEVSRHIVYWLCLNSRYPESCIHVEPCSVDCKQSYFIRRRMLRLHSVSYFC